MTKNELCQRLDTWSRQRYGVPFTKAFLDDLIKDDLIPRSTRRGNKGKSPVHFWGKGAYRRGLQIARMRANGIRRRNSQRVFLFLNGYSYPVGWVREPLRVEYASFGRELLSPVRSRHLAGKQDIPAGQKARLIKSFGEPDQSFSRAGLRLPENLVVALIRAATQDPVNTGPLGNEHAKLNEYRRSLSGANSFDAVWGHAIV